MNSSHDGGGTGILFVTREKDKAAFKVIKKERSSTTEILLKTN
jgi:hypothetical protein